MRTTFCIIIVMLFIGAVVSADNRTVALDDEPRLSKPITLTLRATALKDVLAAVEKETGVHLLVQHEIAEDKATVCVKDQPAREVLRALAHCFNVCWSPSPRTADKPYLRLWMDRDYLALMFHRQYQDYLSIAGQFDKELKDTAEYARLGQEYTLDGEMMARLYKDNKAEYVRQGKRRDIIKSAARSAMVLQFFALSEKQKESLYAGNHITFSGAEIRADTLKRWPEAKSFDYAIDRTTSGCILRCGARPGAGTISISSAYFDNSPYYKEADLLTKQILADAAFDKALPEGTKFATDAAISAGEGSAAVPGTMSDGLLELAKTANIPMVVQYVSEYKGASANWETQTVKLPASNAKKVGDRLAELSRQHTFTVFRDGDFLLGRSLLWHRQRLAEVPEARIRAWQKSFCGLAQPMLKDYVDMASMRWEQVRGITGNVHFWFGDQELFPLIQSEYALRIYGTLTKEQQQWLLSGRELPVSMLTPEQQSNFMCGYEVREKPTFESAIDENWPQTASISLHDDGFGDTRIYAAAGMRPLGKVQPDETAFDISDKTPREDIQKIVNNQMNILLPSLTSKLRTQVAKDHPDVAAKDVSLYSIRSCTFIFKLGDKTRKCGMNYSAKVK